MSGAFSYPLSIFPYASALRFLNLCEGNFFPNAQPAVIHFGMNF